MSSWQQQRQRMDSEDEDGEIEEEGEIVIAPAPGIGSGDASNIDGGSGSDSNNKNNSITTINAPPSNSAGGTLGSQQKAVAQPQSNNRLPLPSAKGPSHVPTAGPLPPPPQSSTSSENNPGGDSAGSHPSITRSIPRNNSWASNSGASGMNRGGPGAGGGGRGPPFGGRGGPGSGGRGPPFRPGRGGGPGGGRGIGAPGGERAGGGPPLRHSSSYQGPPGSSSGGGGVGGRNASFSSFADNGPPPPNGPQHPPPMGAGVPNTMNRPTDPRFRGSDNSVRPLAGGFPPPKQQSSLPIPPPPPPKGAGGPHGSDGGVTDHHRITSYSSLADTSVGSAETPADGTGFGSRGPPPPRDSGPSSFRAKNGPPADLTRGSSGEFGGPPPPGAPPLPPPHSRDSSSSFDFADGGQRPPEFPPRQQSNDNFRGPMQPQDNIHGQPPSGEFVGGESGFPSRQQQQRDSFRGPPGNRRGSEFRGPHGGDPHFRPAGGADTSYYGPASDGSNINNKNNEFQRRRSRPHFHPGAGASPGPGSIPRQGSFGQGFGRRSFTNNQEGGPPGPPEQVRSFASSEGPPNAAEGPPQDRPPFFRKPSFSQPKQSSTAEGAAHTDPFGRTRNWSRGSRSSPHSSPQQRKPVLSQSFNKSPPPKFPSATNKPLRVASSSDGPAVDSSQGNAGGIPDFLLTSALGDSNVERAEKGVELLVELMQNPSLKVLHGKISELPTKSVLSLALDKMGTKIKQAQSVVEGKRLEVDEAEREEEMAQQKAKEEADSELKRQEEERVRLAEERRKEEEKVREMVVNNLQEEQRRAFEAEEEESFNSMKQKIKLAKKEKEHMREKDLNLQIIAASETYDKDIVKAQNELGKVMRAAKKTEVKITTVETEFRSKAQVAEQQSGAGKPPKIEDVVANVLADNRKRASEAHMFQFATVPANEMLQNDTREQLEKVRDPKNNKTNAEWAQLMKQVTGLSDALYTEPPEAPYYEHNEKIHALIRPLVKEYVRDKQKRLNKHWTELAEEYEYRKRVHDKQLRKKNSKGKRHSVSVRRASHAPLLESAGGRNSTNPYRRTRRGNEVRTDYEQELIIAELASKEAMEKRIAFGGCKPLRQVGRLERQLTATHFKTFKAQKVDFLAIEADIAISNVWSDMEKCIFLDRFLQHPKDFRKIGSFLRNKTTKDCVEFYYDSKQTIPYKAALREHIMRRKRRGDYHVWDATIEAALSVGAVVEAGTSEEKPLIFSLPEDDNSYFMRDFHPLKREIFDAMDIDEQALEAYEEESGEDEPQKPGWRRKRQREPLFLLDEKQRKFLCTDSRDTPFPRSFLKNTQSKTSESNEGAKEESGRLTPVRKAPQKWTASEKKIFLDSLEKHGRNWNMLSEAIGTKSIQQIKNFYYDYIKKQAGKQRSDSKKSNKPSAKIRRRQEQLSTSSPTLPSPMPEMPVEETRAEDPVSSIALQQLRLQQEHEQLLNQAKHLHSQSLRTSHPEDPSGSHLSGASTPDAFSASEIWAQTQAQQQALLLQQQQTSQNQISEETTRQLLGLQHHSHNQHQQILSNLLPWVTQMAQPPRPAANTNMPDLEVQQLQNLLQLQRQAAPNSHVRSLGLAGLPGLANPNALSMAIEQQQQSQQQQATDVPETQLRLAQRLLALQGAGVGGHDLTSAADAMNLLARSLPRTDGSKNFHGSAPGDNRGQHG